MPAVCAPDLVRELRDIATSIRRGRPYTAASDLERLAAAILSRGFDPGPDAAPQPAEPTPALADVPDFTIVGRFIAGLPAGTTITLGGGRSE